MKMCKFENLMVLFLIVLGNINTHAQEINSTEINKAIGLIAKTIRENYVYKTKGESLASCIQEENKKGKYKAANTWKEFSSMISKDMKEYAKDLHLYVEYDPLTVKDLQSESQDNQAPPATDSLDKAKNFGFKEVKILEGNIGYIKINWINFNEKSLPLLMSAMTLVSNTKALIIDFQNNGGGGGYGIGPMFESIFLPANTPLLEGKSREGVSFGGKTMEWLPIKRYEKPLYFMINKKTGSAAEAIPFLFQHLKRAKIVGQTSAGAANMNSWYPINKEIFLSVSTSTITLPNTDISWEQIGVKPDYPTNIGEEIELIKSIVNK